MILVHHRPHVAAVVIAMTWSALALAQPAPATPAAPAPTATPSAVAIAPMTCTNPGDVPKKDMDRFQKKNDEYRKCVMDYVEQLRNKAVDSANTARAYQDAANVEIEKYNNYVNTINEQAKKSGG